MSAVQMGHSMAELMGSQKVLKLAVLMAHSTAERLDKSWVAWKADWMVDLRAAHSVH